MSDTLPGIGTTAGAQAANNVVAATATATGTITFVGPQGIQGSVITAVITVPNAPDTAVFTATLGTIGGQGVIVDTWGGGSTAGQFQVLVGQTLVVTGTGLAQGGSYTCTFGLVTDVGDVQVVIPTPNSSAIVAQLGQPVTILTIPKYVSGTLTQFAIPIGVKTLVVQIIDLGAGGLATNVLINNGNAFPLYNQAPYLPSPFGGQWVVVPIPPFYGPNSSFITITGPDASGYLVTIYGDTAQYDESVFYNGVAQSAPLVAVTGAGTTTLLTGPARLLTAFLEAAPGVTGFLIVSGQYIARVDVPVGGNTVVAPITFPPNYILPAGNTVAVQSTGAPIVSGGVSYAYP
jgi:hypothetical protein